jgi:hypothetical protein
MGLQQVPRTQSSRTLGLRLLMDAGVLLEGLRLLVVATGTWQDRPVVELPGTPIPDDEAPPFEVRCADQKAFRSCTRLGIGFDEYAVSVDTETGMVLGMTARMQSIRLHTTSVEMVEFDLPLRQELFLTR